MTDKSIDMPKRPAKWVNVNTRLEKHGDSEVLCADISVRGFHIDKAEYNFVRKEKHAWDRHFYTEAKGKPAEPIDKNEAPTKITDSYDGCEVAFGLGLTDNKIEFEDCKVTSIVLDEQVGGLTLMDYMVQTEIEDTDDVARLLEYLNSDSTIAMTLGEVAKPRGKKAQQKLDLSVPAADKPKTDGEGTQPGVH